MNDSKRRLWTNFCEVHAIAARSTPLFVVASADQVETFAYGRDGRRILRRSPQMEALLTGEVERCATDATNTLEGVLYMMLRLDGAGTVVPLYIGRAGQVGRNGGISANVRSIRTNTGKFARWGYNYAYHMGDLSAAVLPGHSPGKSSPKYQRWAQSLFKQTPSAAPRLRADVRFWCAAWGPASPNIWPEFGSCSLSFMEYLLIGVGSLLFPEDLLNREGVNAPAGEEQIGRASLSPRL